MGDFAADLWRNLPMFFQVAIPVQVQIGIFTKVQLKNRLTPNAYDSPSFPTAHCAISLALG
jgi:hypothetical protein